jgi:AcrR family transcriptional regulator
MVVYSFTVLKSKYKKIHKGEILQAAVNKSDLRITQIVKKAGYSRSSYYHHIGNEELSYEILETYGRAMKYDFTEDLPEMSKYLVEDSSEAYTLLTPDEAIKQRDYWKDKYYTLLEKYHLLIEERITTPGKKK